MRLSVFSFLACVSATFLIADQCQIAIDHMQMLPSYEITIDHISPLDAKVLHGEAFPPLVDPMSFAIAESEKHATLNASTHNEAALKVENDQDDRTMMLDDDGCPVDEDTLFCSECGGGYEYIASVEWRCKGITDDGDKWKDCYCIDESRNFTPHPTPDENIMLDDNGCPVDEDTLFCCECGGGFQHESGEWRCKGITDDGDKWKDCYCIDETRNYTPYRAPDSPTDEQIIEDIANLPTFNADSAAPNRTLPRSAT